MFGFEAQDRETDDSGDFFGKCRNAGIFPIAIDHVEQYYREQVRLRTIVEIP